MLRDTHDLNGCRRGGARRCTRTCIPIRYPYFLCLPRLVKRGEVKLPERSMMQLNVKGRWRKIFFTCRFIRAILPILQCGLTERSKFIPPRIFANQRPRNEAKLTNETLFFYILKDFPVEYWQRERICVEMKRFAENKYTFEEIFEENFDRSSACTYIRDDFAKRRE